MRLLVITLCAFFIDGVSEIMSSDYSSVLSKKCRSKRSLFDNLDRSDLRNYLSSSKTSLAIPEEVRALRKIKYQKVAFSDSSTEEEASSGRESHVDSQDEGLFKEGYFLKRSSSRLGKNQVDQEVKEWKQAAEKNLNELTSEYNKGSKKKVSFSIPLGLEMNRRVRPEAGEDGSTVFSKSVRSSNMTSEDELDMERNEEFMQEVRRVFRSKKNPETLVKRSLQEEYGRQLSKKMSAVCRWAQRQLIPNAASDQKALPEKGNPSHTDTGAGGENTSGAVEGIFEQLSQMVLKNKISKKSRAARKEILKRAEEKREKLVELSKNSEVEEVEIERPACDKKKVKKVRFLAGSTKPGSCTSPTKMVSKIEKSEENVDRIVPGENQIAIYTGTDVGWNRRQKKVEIYLASTANTDLYSSSEDEENYEILTAEEEKYVFDGLAGEFLGSLRTQCVEQGKMSRNDRKFLRFLVTKFIERGELSVIDELLRASVDDCKMKIPPYENVEDRERYFLTLLIAKYIKRGMRTILEDKIALAYYGAEAAKKKSKESSGLDAQDKPSEYVDVQRLVEAFRSSGGNDSLNRLVEEMHQERLQENANMTNEEIAKDRLQIRDMIVARFARMYLEGNVPELSNVKGADGTNETVASSNEDPGNETKKQRGVEHFDMNGQFFEVQWKTPGVGDEFSDSDDQRSAISVPPTREPSDVYVKITKPSTSVIKENFYGRLHDTFWNKLQSCQTQPSGKRRRFCTPVSKRGISLIGGSKATPKNYLRSKTKPVPSVEDLRKRLREDNVRWLTEQKNKLWEARNKEAKSIDEFTMSLPKRMEQIIQRRSRLQKDLIEREKLKFDKSGKRKNPRS